MKRQLFGGAYREAFRVRVKFRAPQEKLSECKRIVCATAGRNLAEFEVKPETFEPIPVSSRAHERFHGKPVAGNFRRYELPRGYGRGA
ncbi:MAG TPA: hypothetical protein VK619_11455 [Pyrinomonadaceae bacterium]|nr:hypothetical protein [Pyrinomonadaceae bacterium]